MPTTALSCSALVATISWRLTTQQLVRRVVGCCSLLHFVLNIQFAGQLIQWWRWHDGEAETGGNNSAPSA